MSPERITRIDTMLQQQVTDNELPGAIALIARNGTIIFHKAYGMANNKNKKQMQKEAILRIASQTKAITSTAVLMLCEEGRFKLYDPIYKYIPEFGKAQLLDTYEETDGSYTSKPAKNQITMRDLFTHTPGIG